MFFERLARSRGENPLTGPYAPDYALITVDEYTALRIEVLEERQRQEHGFLLAQERAAFDALWVPFSDVLDELRWARRMQHRHVMALVEATCEREKVGADDGPAAAEQDARLAIYAAWVAEYRRILPGVRAAALERAQQATAAKQQCREEAQRDQWLRVSILDHLNAHDDLRREEWRAREAMHGAEAAEARDILTARTAGVQLFALVDAVEPTMRALLEDTEAAARAQVASPAGSPQHLVLAEALGRMHITAAEAFGRTHGAIPAALRTMLYDLWWAGVKAAGLQRRWRGEDVDSANTDTCTF